MQVGQTLWPGGELCMFHFGSLGWLLAVDLHHSSAAMLWKQLTNKIEEDWHGC